MTENRKPLPHEPTCARAVLARLVDAGQGVSLAARLFPSQPERTALSYLAVNGWARRGRSAVRGQVDYRATALGREQHAHWMKEKREAAQLAAALVREPGAKLSPVGNAAVADAGTCPRCGAKVFDGLRLTACSACGWKRGDASPPAAARRPELALVQGGADDGLKPGAFKADPSLGEAVGQIARAIKSSAALPASPAVRRLLQRLSVGDRVRAACGIFDASSGREVLAGCVGTVRAVNVGGCTPLVSIAWQGGEDEPMTTSAENLEPVLGAAAGECRHPAHVLVHVRVPGRETTLAACRCGQVQASPATPWREPTADEFRSILEHVGYPGPKPRRVAVLHPLSPASAMQLAGELPSAEAERDGWRWSFSCLASLALELTGAAVSLGHSVDGKPFVVVPSNLVDRLRASCDGLPASMLAQREARRELLANVEQLEKAFEAIVGPVDDDGAGDVARFASDAGHFLGAVRAYLRAEEGGS